MVQILHDSRYQSLDMMVEKYKVMQDVYHQPFDEKHPA